MILKGLDGAELLRYETFKIRTEPPIDGDPIRFSEFDNFNHAFSG